MQEHNNYAPPVLSFILVLNVPKNLVDISYNSSLDLTAKGLQVMEELRF